MRAGRIVRLAACIAALAAPAAAQEAPMSPDTFLDAVAGRTVSFVLHPGGGLVGVERFVDRERSVWTRPDGRCALGEVTVRADKLCFAYDDDPSVDHCWWPFKEAGALHVRSTGSGEVQRVAGVKERLLGCEGEPMS